MAGSPSSSFGLDAVADGPARFGPPRLLLTATSWITSLACGTHSEGALISNATTRPIRRRVVGFRLRPHREGASRAQALRQEAPATRDAVPRNDSCRGGLRRDDSPSPVCRHGCCGHGVPCVGASTPLAPAGLGAATMSTAAPTPRSVSGWETARVAADCGWSARFIAGDVEVDHDARPDDARCVRS